MRKPRRVLLALLALPLVTGCGSNIGVEVVRSVPSAQEANGTPIAPAGTAVASTPASARSAPKSTAAPTRWLTATSVPTEPATPTPTLVAGARLPPTRGASSGLAIDVGPDDTLHIAWADQSEGRPAILYARSTDGGYTFSPEVMLNDGESSVSVSPPSTAVALSTEGKVYVAFRTSSPRDGVVIHYDRRKDGSFGRDATLAGGKEGPVPSRPAMASDGQGRVFLAWGEHDGGSVHVYLARAEAGGDFSTEGRVIGGETGIEPGS